MSSRGTYLIIFNLWIVASFLAEDIIIKLFLLFGGIVNMVLGAFSSRNEEISCECTGEYYE